MSIACEYALSGRAGCRGCHTKIAKDEVRIGELTPGEWGDFYMWYHSGCFDWAKIRKVENLCGFYSLRREDQTMLKAVKRGGASALPSGSSSAGAASQVARWSGAPLVLPGREEVEVEQERDRDVRYGGIRMTVVGCQYYQGVIHQNEFATLIREPHNQYDSNAVRVDNLAGQQVGHIKRTCAAALAPLLDDASPWAPRIEAVVSGAMSHYNVSVTVNVWGPPELFSATAAHLKVFGLALTGGDPSLRTEADASGIVTGTEEISGKKAAEELDKMLDQVSVDPASLDTAPVQKALAGRLASDLLQHQLQGVAWMLLREQTDTPLPFWKEVVEKGRRFFFNDITNTSWPDSPGPVKGGILADDMGLGKTLQVLSLILANPPPGVSYPARLHSVPPPSEDTKRGYPSEDTSSASLQIVEAFETPSLSTETPLKKEDTSPSEATLTVGTPPSEASELPSMKSSLAQLRAMASKLGQSIKGSKKLLLDRIRRSSAPPPVIPEPKPEANPGPAPDVIVIEDVEETKTARKGSKGKRPKRLVEAGAREDRGLLVGSRATLIVCPTSVLGNWVEQAAQHLAGVDLKVLLYHGSNRRELHGDEDIVVTTYGTLTAEYDAHYGASAPKAGSKRKLETTSGTLFGTEWHRIALDEAHSIRNSQTKGFKAVSALSATHRWCLTGTPMQNKVEDFHSLLAFLKAKPVDDKAIFAQAIGRPLRAGSMEGMARLRVVLSALCLRRTKAVLAGMLPDRKVEVHTIRLDPAHREAYTAIFESARAAYQALLTGGGEAAVMSEYNSVLECLLRLRQVCCSLALVPPGRLGRARQVLAELRSRPVARNGKSKPLSAEEAKKLLQKLKSALTDSGEAGNGTAVFECAVCLGDLEEEKARVLRTCSHCFCDYCLDRIVRVAHGGRVACPMCRGPFSAKDVLQSQTLQDASAVPEPPRPQPTLDSPDPCAASSSEAALPPKVEALLEALQKEWREDASQKAVVFSQFTSMLDLVAPLLHTRGIQTGRLDGGMSHEQRAHQIAAFQAEEGGPRVLLVSLKAGGAGVNLVRANLVFMLDLWWNAGAEEQAMDRVHRIGQRRAVRVVRYVCEQTVEERMMQIQESKRVVGAAAMTRSQEELRRARVSDLSSIFALH